MDVSYASTEQLGSPYLRGKAIVIGGGEARGMIATASYEARQYGVRSAMSGVLARKRCPHFIFVLPCSEWYKEILGRIRSIPHRYTDSAESFPLGEAYLDVIHNKVGNLSAALIAQKVRQAIFAETGLTASVGISTNKFTAKIASDINKPNGQKIATQDEVQDFLNVLNVKKFYGIGKVTAKKMYVLGVFIGKDLRQKLLVFLERNFGDSGEHYYQLARGIHNGEVQPFRTRKSVEAEQTFAEGLISETYILGELDNIASEVVMRLAQ